MASTPRFKVYDSSGVYQAACKDATLAGAVVAVLGEGATIRDGHSFVVWLEGCEIISAGESYDQVATTVNARVTARRILGPIEIDNLERLHGEPR